MAVLLMMGQKVGAFLLRGLWHSGVWLGEALGMTWYVPGTLRPYRHRSGHVVLEIPATSQKSKADTTIPTTPEFARCWMRCRAEQRTGFVFSPASSTDSAATHCRSRGEGDPGHRPDRGCW